MRSPNALATLFMAPEAYVAHYLGTARHFGSLARHNPADRNHWLALARESVWYARRMRLEAC